MTDGYSPCVLCGNTRRALLFTLDMGRIVQCDRCELVSMVERRNPALITCAYDRSYFFPDAGKSVGYPDYFGAEERLRRQVATHLASALTRRYPHARLSLDVGCGGGYLVDALRQQGLSAWGTDPAAAVLDGAAPDVREHLLHGAVDSPQVVERGPYDLVTAMDVIEHIADPVDFLRSSFGLLKENGALILLTPRFDGWLSRAAQASYVHFNVDHVYYFSAQCLQRCVHLATRQRPTTMDVVAFWKGDNVEVASSVYEKYTQRRDSMVALCQRTAA